MKTSELFQDIVTSHGGSPAIDCQFCKRTHFTHEAENYQELCELAKKHPDKYLESGDDSIGWGYLDGRQYVYMCSCDSGARYEEFIWRHRELICEYLKRRTAANTEKAEEDVALVRDLLP